MLIVLSYSMAFLVSLALESDPTELVYSQQDMRSHLSICLETATLNTFPTIKRRRTVNKVTKEEECALYCYCRMPDDHNEMVQCELCNEWFHWHCVTNYSPGSNWSCSKCE